MAGRAADRPPSAAAPNRPHQQHCQADDGDEDQQPGEQPQAVATPRDHPSDRDAHIRAHLSTSTTYIVMTTRIIITMWRSCAGA
jgi:hypothetical protein